MKQIQINAVIGVNGVSVQITNQNCNLLEQLGVLDIARRDTLDKLKSQQQAHFRKEGGDNHG